MEQQLINILERAKNEEDIDEVSKLMIMTRVINALDQVRDATQKYLEKLESIQKEHEMELKLGGLTVVLNVTDDVASKEFNGPTQMCVLGSGGKVQKNLQQIMEHLHG